MTTLKKNIQNTRGLQYIIDQTEVLSPIGRRYLYAESWSSDAEELTHKFDLIDRCSDIIKALDKKSLSDIEHLICQSKDIERTISSLAHHTTLTDIELFEIKSFALISNKIREFVKDWNLVNIPSLDDVIDILDPEHTHTAAFYIYNIYDDRLAELRVKLKTAIGEEATELYVQAASIEDEIKCRLSTDLLPFIDDMCVAIQNIAYLDILIAKYKLNSKLGLTRPLINDAKSMYHGLFNPEIQASLKAKRREYQAIDIDLLDAPTLITGINMGGKTVVLKTLALAQSLCQLGFFVPAASAEIVLVDDIMVSMDDNQNELSGLSSFASEMTQINEIICRTKRGTNILVLIDELARTTNPTEGRAIVEAMIEFLSEHRVRSFITTHYDHITTPCRRLRVKGLKEMNESINIKQIDQMIDYSLVEVDSNEVPHEALNIATLLDVDPEFIASAKSVLKRNYTQV